eukprot:CAMPEP_0201144592 /NCGR_PEP_ID=MMETSP0851-20130426/6362_1 /ASSEMBLY_ACC=CAM_ASM_000631 /TAXON_ID=183588 /ORGANISM="Pseudo-nitzschia fraudulenta, Strain WWA7" /LENGTH=548 /DNA_ID=CAMNT_0047419425 /DNA_START=34 /DNA_END=1680 /DNA_ORIENTATION=+
MTETENPIDNDDRLKGLLSAIPEVKSKKAYIAWRKSFLKIYTKHLDPNGILNGKDSNYRLLKQLRALSLRIADAESLLASKSDAAASSNSSSAAAMTTIEGRRVLTNLTEEVAASETKVNEFMPKTNADEEKFGFDKFELAAVLLEDGFHGYDRMKETKDALEQITSGLVGNNNNETSGDGSSVSVVDDNFQKIIRNYSNAVQSFLEVMEDLGLFSVVKQCVDVAYQGKERPEPQDPALSVPEEQDDESSGEGSLGDGSTTYSSSSDGSDGNSQSASEDGGPEDGQKKKKKKKEKSESSKKKKKTKGIKGGEETLPGGNNNNNSNGQSQAPASSWQNPMGSAGSQSGAPSDGSTEEEKEEPPPEEGEGGEEPEFLIYFDPKTNGIGMINRIECAARSQLVIDETKENDDGNDEVYQNVILDTEEKREIIVLLKKLERQKPVESSWLDEIKKEKNGSKGKGGKKKKKLSKSTAGISKRSNKGEKEDKGAKNNKPKSRKSLSSSFRSPFGEEDNKPVSTKIKKKATVQDYQGTYRKAAAKPDAGGWEKMV